MTQRERIVARVQTLPDERLPQVESCLDYVELEDKDTNAPVSLSSAPCCATNALGGGDVSGALATRWDVLTRVRAGFQRIRGDRASTATLYEVYQRSRPELSLSRSQFHEILVEWSSPLVAGYLGREEGQTADDDQFWLVAVPAPVNSELSF
ncbi:MAG: hypothetical protein AAF685_14775 [Cyanobacteria bacterium P01_C01_bin.89]